MVDTWPGLPYPLGAAWDGEGTNFALFSSIADAVELCLFSQSGEEQRVTLLEQEGDVWHAYVPGVGPGQRYGYRVHGPWDPGAGHRCNANKLLLDPYAKAIEGRITWCSAVHGYAGTDFHAGPDPQDSAPHVPRSVVINPYFDWGHDRPPRIPWQNTVVYELHVKGFTKLHPKLPEALRGTYAGLGHPAAIEHLLGLGVTTVELMPIHQILHERHLDARGLRNYWGYSSIGYFAPHDEYAARGRGGEQVAEMKSMVRALHEAGIEVLLDVVYNHTGEGDHTGPTLSFRGIDNLAYYRLQPDKRLYLDFSGCGNTLDATHPHALQLIMDSLRYWVLEMHVDGFRFDLAPALLRHNAGVDAFSAFLDVVQQDPVISRVKLVAEPWDLGPQGYQVGRFPPLWSEWNGRYRDAVRAFWRGDTNTLGELASRLAGSSDLYETTGRKPFASVNILCTHDGFTLRDLVSFASKHNEANGESNRDGENHNLSFNCGVEGPTDDAAVVALRKRQQRNLLATLLLSQGVPMICAGDEMGRTQRGNNNAYCQDNETSWIDWAGRDRALAELTRELLALRAAHPVLRRRAFFAGKQVLDTGLRDIEWYRPDGTALAGEGWRAPDGRALAAFLNGDGIAGRDARGEPIKDDSFFLILNGSHSPVSVMLPAALGSESWTTVIDTASHVAPASSFGPGDSVVVDGPSVVLLVRARRRSSVAPPTA